jgi:zinc-ribbon domain
VVFQVLRRIIVQVVVVIAVVVALTSLSYPSVVVSKVSTQPLPGFVTYMTQYNVEYTVPSTSTILLGYSTVTAWYPGNPICDPMSNACTPYPTPTATYVYAISNTYTYQVALSSQTTSTYTSELTSSSTQTSFQHIPPYAAAGLTGFQYGVVSIAIVALLILGLLILFVRKRSVAVSGGQVAESTSPKATRFCQACGTENPTDGKFCTRCGTQLD